MSFEIASNLDQMSNRREKIEEEINDFNDKVEEKFSPVDSKKITEALDFMLKIHLPQQDRVDGKPFASHPLAVAEKTMDLDEDPELVTAALLHDSVEDQPDRVFLERFNRKYPGHDYLNINIDEKVKEKNKNIFTNWSFREIKEKFGDRVGYYVENMTNHDFNSLAESLGLNGEERRDFVYKMYAEHVENIINDPKLFTLKLADLSTNIDLHSLEPGSKKYLNLKRKYKSVIEAVLEKLKEVKEGHPLYKKKDATIAELNKIYAEQYSE